MTRLEKNYDLHILIGHCILFLFIVFTAVAVSGCSSIYRGKTLTLSKPVYGQDFLGLQNKNFNVSKAIKFNENLEAFGVIYNTFGTRVGPIRSLLQRSSLHYFRVHILNTTCNTNKVCKPYEFTYGFSSTELDTAIKRKNQKLLKGYREAVERIHGLSSEFPQVTFLLSPAVEHHLSFESWRILADEALSVWPGVQLVNSPGFGVSGERYRGAYLEKHSNTNIQNAEIISLDGTDATDIDIDKFINDSSNARIVFLWTRSYNCRNQGPFQDPRRRTSCPLDSTFELMSHILDDRGPAPTNSSCKPFKSPNIWKPLAEDKGNGDSRANKPVTLISSKGDRAHVIDFRGKVIGTLPYYGTYQNSLYRYYSGSKGGSNYGAFRFEKEAEQTSGSPYTFIKVGKACFGPIVTGKRQGNMR